MQSKRRVMLVITLCLTIAMLIGLTVFASPVSAETLDGWVKQGENWYYYHNDYQYKDGIYNIEGECYYFDADGVMAAGEWVEHNEETYYAKPNGPLCDSEVYRIEGKLYLFDYGMSLLTGEEPFSADIWNGEEWIWEYYLTKEDGSLYENEWYPFESTDPEVESGWMYFGADGAAARNEVVRIGGVLYGFDGIGVMYDNEMFSFYVDNGDEPGTIARYRAKAGGALYENEWFLFVDEDDDVSYWNYYGQDGKAPHGYAFVNGVPYVFWYGEMYDGPGFSQDYQSGIYYYIAKGGYATPINANGWTMINDRWVYCKDGEMYDYGVYNIDGVYYAFNGGYMVAGELFEMWDWETDEWSYYRAKADGSLYTNEWYQNRQGYWFYYGADAKAANGLMAIGGAWYYFEDGYAYQNQIMEFDGYVYVFGDDCSATYTQNGWLKDYEGDWLYVVDGMRIQDGLYEIDGVLYAFNYGLLVSYERAYYYEGNYYLVGDDGVVVKTPGWYTANGDYVLVTDDATLAMGWEKDVNGTWYYLQPNMIHSTMELEIEYGEDNMPKPRLYAFATSGAYTEITADGLYTTAMGRLVLVSGGKVVTDSWQYINGAWYYFDAYGSALTGSHMIGENFYYFQQDGRMVEGGWYQYNAGVWIYAQSGGALLTGKQEIGGVTYYFDYSGVLATNTTGYMDGKIIMIGDSGAVVLEQEAVQGWNLINGAWYFVSGDTVANGYWRIDDEEYYFLNYKMIANTERNGYYYGESGAAIKNQWAYLADGWIYAHEDGYLASDGEYYIGENAYLFKDYRLVVNQTIYMWGSLYTTDANGVIIDIDYDGEDIPDGWSYQTDGVYGYAVYYKDGQPYTGWVGDYFVDYGDMRYNTMIEYNNNLYYLDGKGLLIRDRWITEKYQIGENEFIYEYALAKADGSLYENQWLAWGGVWYYFDGCWTVSGGVRTIDGVMHEFDNNGVWLGEYQEPEEPTGFADGWNYFEGQWYYFMADQPVQGSIYVDGQWYYLLPEMVKNDFAMVGIRGGYDAGGYDESKIYYYGASGARANYTGWQYIEGEWVYFNADHSVATGWITVDGANYYMVMERESTGRTFSISMTTGYQAINGDLYYFNASGACTGKIVANGWYQGGSDWYYFVDGKMVYSEGIEIDGNKYYFNYNGTMATNTVMYYDGDCYLGADGVMIRNAWALTEDGWVYANEDGELLRGIHNIGGTVYYFDYVYLID